MWENCHDYDAEVEAQMKPKPEQPNPIDLTRLEALHAEATRFYANGRIELTHDDETARRWAVVIFEAFPALLAELKDLRARVAELSSGAVELTDGTKEYNDLIAECDRLRAERDAARDEAAGLREAAREVEVLVSGGYFVPHETLGALTAALSRTSDQHRARIEAEGLRRLAEKMDRVYGEGQAAHCLTDEAERLERGE